MQHNYRWKEDLAQSISQETLQSQLSFQKLKEIQNNIKEISKEAYKQSMDKNVGWNQLIHLIMDQELTVTVHNKMLTPDIDNNHKTEILHFIKE